MSCFGNTNVNETFIIEPASESLSACTGFYTNIIGSCTGNTQILLGTNTIKFIGQLSGDSIVINSISATTYQNLPIDIRVTGGTYSNGTATFKNNTGGTFTVSGFTVTSGGGTFTGGTVSGATNFISGLTANTISATTYLNLPIDIRVTGATYSNNTFTHTNNTGGTYSVLFNTMTGLTATTISATTYLGLPVTPFVYSYSVWVSPNGSATGALGRIDLPFSTVLAAIQKLKDGEIKNYTIFVMPGSYIESPWSFNASIQNTTIKFCGNVRIVFNVLEGSNRSSIVVNNTTVSFIGDDRTVSSSVNVFNNVSISNDARTNGNIFEIFGLSFVNISNLSIMPDNNENRYSNSDIIIYDFDGNSPKVNINNCTLISESDYNITSKNNRLNGSISINDSYISSVSLKNDNNSNFSNISINPNEPDLCGYWQITNTNFRMAGLNVTTNDTHIYTNNSENGVWGRLNGCIFYKPVNSDTEDYIWFNNPPCNLDIVGTIYATCGNAFKDITPNFGTAEVYKTMLDPENFYR